MTGKCLIVRVLDQGQGFEELVERAKAAHIPTTRVMRLRRLLIGEATRFPDLADDYYRLAPGRVMSTLAAAMESLAHLGLRRPRRRVRPVRKFAAATGNTRLARGRGVAESGSDEGSFVAVSVERQQPTASRNARHA
jgi:hypothetical protein